MKPQKAVPHPVIVVRALCWLFGLVHLTGLVLRDRVVPWTQKLNPP